MGWIPCGDILSAADEESTVGVGLISSFDDGYPGLSHSNPPDGFAQVRFYSLDVLPGVLWQVVERPTIVDWALPSGQSHVLHFNVVKVLQEK